jgi:hypothetical protein
VIQGVPPVDAFQGSIQRLVRPWGAGVAVPKEYPDLRQDETDHESCQGQPDLFGAEKAQPQSGSQQYQSGEARDLAEPGVFPNVTFVRDDAHGARNRTR